MLGKIRVNFIICNQCQILKNIKTSCSFRQWLQVFINIIRFRFSLLYSYLGVITEYYYFHRLCSVYPFDSAELRHSARRTNALSDTLPRWPSSRPHNNKDALSKVLEIHIGLGSFLRPYSYRNFKNWSQRVCHRYVWLFY